MKLAPQAEAGIPACREAGAKPESCLSCPAEMGQRQPRRIGNLSRHYAARAVSGCQERRPPRQARMPDATKKLRGAAK